MRRFTPGHVAHRPKVFPAGYLSTYNVLSKRDLSRAVVSLERKDFRWATQVIFSL